MAPTRVPTFCRHNHLIQNCPICSREQSIEARPLVSSSAPKVGQPREPQRRSPRDRTATSGGHGTVRVRTLARDLDDGYRSPLAPGLRSSADAERLSEELAFAGRRLATLTDDPPGLYRQVGDPSTELEERTWLCLLIAYLSPLQGAEPFSSISRVFVQWTAAGELTLDEVQTGPRTAHDPSRGLQTIAAYRAWVERAGSQAAAFTGEPAWTPERRFERLFERLALPGLTRDARVELLVTLGQLDCYEIRAGKLALGGDNAVTIAAKRVFGIGDSLLLERRAADLAAAASVPLEALDLALVNWSRTAEGEQRITGGLGEQDEPDPGLLASSQAALGL